MIVARSSDRNRKAKDLGPTAEQSIHVAVLTVPPKHSETGLETEPYIQLFLKREALGHSTLQHKLLVVGGVPTSGRPPHHTILVFLVQHVYQVGSSPRT